MLLNQCAVVLSPSFSNFTLLHLLKFVECLCLQNNSKHEDLNSKHEEIGDANLNVWHEISIDNGEVEPTQHFKS